MQKHILVFNAGSSSLKWCVYTSATNLSLKLSGNIEKIGEESSKISIKEKDTKNEKEEKIDDHLAAVQYILKTIKDHGMTESDFSFVGHRVVHGGLSFDHDVAYKVDESVLKKIEELEELSPLHNPVNLEGIQDTIKVFKNVPQVVVFDTTFHLTLSETAYKYALPYDKLGPEVRKFGFHGISYKYVSLKAIDFLKSHQMKHKKLIIMHLGNGSSVCATKDGKSIDTSMGITPLQGLMMGTRTGDMDPSAVFHILRKYYSPINEKSVDQVEELVNKKSGLKGICGMNDMRSIVKEMKTNKDAKLAFDMFVYRIKQYVGSYFVTLGGCDAIVFTGGIGEHSSEVRAAVVKELECIGVELDQARNNSEEGTDLSAENSKVRVLRINTSEEVQIAKMGIELFQ